MLTKMGSLKDKILANAKLKEKEEVKKEKVVLPKKEVKREKYGKEKK